MGVFLQKQGNGYRKDFYGSWQVNGRREYRRLTPWEGVPPSEPMGKGDALFEQSKAEAARMLERFKAGGDETMERVRWILEKEIKKCTGEGGQRADLARLLRLLGELQVKIALSL